MIFLGRISEFENNENRYKFPSIKTLINKPIKEKEKVIKYMKKCEVVAVAPAIVRDVLNPKIKIPELFLMSDGKYEWRSDLIYYVEKYDLELPDDFIEHVLSRQG